MKIAKVQISNILGIDSLDFKPGKITTISGQNGSGKTSILEAIKSTVGGGHDATLLRKGATEGKVVLEFDNGETLTKKMTEFKSKIKLEDHEGREVKKSASYLKDIIDPVGINPVQILTADPKKRVNMLLDSVQMELPADEIKMITGLDVSGDTRHPLKVIDEKRKDIFDERAYINAEVKKLQTMIDEMGKTVPFKPDASDWASQVEKLRGEQGKLKDDREKALEQVNKSYADEISKQKEEAQKEIDNIKDALAKKLESLGNIAIDSRNGTETLLSPPIEELTIKITEADQNAKNQAKISGAVEFIEKNKKEIELQESESKNFTGQINSLDILKSELLANLPVKGLEVVDGDILIDGIPFDTLNEAARISFALMIAGLRKTKLPLVCVDGLESLDESVFKIFKEEAEKTDMQFFVTRVSEEKLTVE